MPSSALVITPEDRATLESWTRSSTVPVGHGERARIVMAIADGAGTTGAARIVGVSRPTVIKWRDRFAANGIAGLDDEARPGRPKTVDDAAILAATLEAPPETLAVTRLAWVCRWRRRPRTRCPATTSGVARRRGGTTLRNHAQRNWAEAGRS